MLIENVKAAVKSVVTLTEDAKDRDNWRGRSGKIERLDIGQNMLFEYLNADGDPKYCQTTTVFEILVRGNWIEVKTEQHLYVLERR